MKNHDMHYPAPGEQQTNMLKKRYEKKLSGEVWRRWEVGILYRGVESEWGLVWFSLKQLRTWRHPNTLVPGPAPRRLKKLDGGHIWASYDVYPRISSNSKMQKIRTGISPLPPGKSLYIIPQPGVIIKLCETLRLRDNAGISRIWRLRIDHDLREVKITGLFLIWNLPAYCQCPRRLSGSNT